MEEMVVETLNNRLLEAVKSAEEKYRTRSRGKEDKICTDTKKLMEKRRELKNKNDTNRDELRQLNRIISKAVRNDVRQYNTNQVTTDIEENQSLRVLRRSLAAGKKNTSKLADQKGQITSNRDEIIKIVEKFYRELYRE